MTPNHQQTPQHVHIPNNMGGGGVSLALLASPLEELHQGRDLCTTSVVLHVRFVQLQTVREQNRAVFQHVQRRDPWLYFAAATVWHP
jgi:hypothetical protein